MTSQFLEGYELVGTHEVAIPYQCWKLDVDVMCDRKLRLTEYTVLALVDAGIQDVEDIRKLMGLSDNRIVSKVVVNLMMRGLLGDNLGLYLSTYGQQALSNEYVKEPRRFTDLTIRFDPYENRFRFDRMQGERKKPSQDGLHILPFPDPLDGRQVEGHYADIQILLNRHIQDIEQSKKVRLDGKLDVLQVKANSDGMVYLSATLNVYHHPVRDEWYWQILRGGVEDESIASKLRQMEREGQTIIPLENVPVLTQTPEAQELHQRVQDISSMLEDHTPQEKPEQQNTNQIVFAQAHRDWLLRAIGEAKRLLLIISPWLKTSAVNDELLTKFRSSLKKNPELKVFIGYGIEAMPNMANAGPTQSEKEALRRLERLQRDFPRQVHLVEFGNTHEKIVVCDDKFAIVTSFNFMSFNPSKVFRRETGMLVRDPGSVKELLEHALSAFRAAEDDAAVSH